jgi:hypothetical protein
MWHETVIHNRLIGTRKKRNCPLTPSLVGVLDAKRTPSPYVTSIALGLVACLIFAGYLCIVALYNDLYPSVYIRWPKPEIVYAAADATTWELLCKIYNAGNGRATIETIYVNATQVNPRAPLPVTIPYGEYATVVLPYEGPWNGPTPWGARIPRLLSC